MVLADPDHLVGDQVRDRQVQAGPRPDEHAVLDGGEVAQQVDVGQHAEVVVAVVLRRDELARAADEGGPHARTRRPALREPLQRGRSEVGEHPQADVVRHRQRGVAAAHAVDAHDLHVVALGELTGDRERRPDGSAHRVGVHDEEANVQRRRTSLEELDSPAHGAGHRPFAAGTRARSDLHHRRDGLGLDAAPAHPRQPRQHRDPAGDRVHARLQRAAVRALQVVRPQLGQAHGLDPQGARRGARRLLRPHLQPLRGQARQGALGRQDAVPHLARGRHGARVPRRLLHRHRPPPGRLRRLEHVALGAVDAPRDRPLPPVQHGDRARGGGPRRPVRRRPLRGSGAASRARPARAARLARRAVVGERARAPRRAGQPRRQAQGRGAQHGRRPDRRVADQQVDEADERGPAGDAAPPPRTARPASTDTTWTTRWR